MTLDDFIQATRDSDAAAPQELPELLLALWHTKRAEWDKAHEIVQSLETHDPLGCTHICIALKVISPTRVIGTAVLTEPSLPTTQLQSGERLPVRYWRPTNEQHLRARPR